MPRNRTTRVLNIRKGLEKRTRDELAALAAAPNPADVERIEYLRLLAEQLRDGIASPVVLGAVVEYRRGGQG